MSDPLRSFKSLAQWLTQFVFHLKWPPFTMFSIFLNLRRVSRYPRRSLKPVPLRSNLIYPTSNHPSKSWTPKKKEDQNVQNLMGSSHRRRSDLGSRILSSTKLPGLPSSQSPNLIIQLQSILESRDEILFRGEGCDIQVIRDIDTRL
jgi:hypothetical protein